MNVTENVTHFIVLSAMC